MSTMFGGGQSGSGVKSGRGARGAFGALAVAITGGVALVTACGGNEFCEESRTCPMSSTGGAGGAGVGGADSAAGGNSADAGATSSAGTSAVVGGAAGQGGEAPVSCKTDADCDDGDACNGTESCKDNVCAAGDAMVCPVGLTCVAPNPLCVPATASPWIVYVSDDDMAGVDDLYAVKPDFLGKMKPLKVTPKLDAGWSMSDVGAWSPDGQSAIVTAVNKAGTETISYLLRFVDGLPQEPLLLTNGLVASKLSKPVWSPSGKSLGIERDDGFFLIDIDADNNVTQTQLDSATQDNVSAWFRSDSEIAFAARNIVTQKFTIALARKSSADWLIDPIVVDIVTNAVLASPDGSLLSYLVFDKATMQATAWSVEAVKGATPTKIAGPFVDLGFQVSSDGKTFAMATTLKLGGESTAFGGLMTMLTTPPVLKAHLLLTASSVVPQVLGNGWSPDGKHAALYQPDSFGRQLVMYEPGAAQEWNPIAVHQIANVGVAGDPSWSPDNQVVSLYGQAAVDAAIQLFVVSTQTHAVRSLDQVAKGGQVRVGHYSAGGEFLAYTKAEAGAPATDGGLVDLRSGFDAATIVPLAGHASVQLFAAHSLDFMYGDGGACYYIDLSGKDPAMRVRINGSGQAGLCRFQVLPK